MSKQIIRMNDGRLNKANLFTFARLPVAWLAIAVYLGPSRLAGVIIMMVAAWTDFFDGVVARKFNCRTDFGAQLDPIVDKIFTLHIIILALVELPRTAVIILALILVSELLNMAITLIAQKTKQLTLKVTWAGKKGMFGKMTGVTWMLLASAGAGGFYRFAEIFGWIAGIIGILLGFYAFCEYVGQTRRAR